MHKPRLKNLNSIFGVVVKQKQIKNRNIFQGLNVYFLQAFNKACSLFNPLSAKGSSWFEFCQISHEIIKDQHPLHSLLCSIKRDNNFRLEFQNFDRSSICYNASPGVGKFVCQLGKKSNSWGWNNVDDYTECAFPR